MEENTKSPPRKWVSFCGRRLIIRHFAGPAIRLVPDGGSVPHDCPCFTLSVTHRVQVN